MAGDWIKMRGGLFNSPKLIGMSRALQASRPFRDWLTPGGGGPVNGQIVSDHALRCVTGALLCVTWSWSREFGKVLPNGDCLLPHIALSDIDGIAGAPTVGEAMESVGWARGSTDPAGVILPKFFAEHNVPLTPAEKQRAYRRRKLDDSRVTETLPPVGNKTVTREEKRREEEKKESTDVDSSLEGELPGMPPAEFSFPFVTGKLWDLPAKKLQEYHATHAGKLDVAYELRKAKQWLMDNKDGRPRSSRGMQGFLTRWLNRASDHARPTMPGSHVAAIPEGPGQPHYDPEGGRIVRKLE